MLPRRGDARPFAIELKPGDLYVLADEARWDWKHGISVPDEEETAARRAIVWRLLVDDDFEPPVAPPTGRSL